MRPWTTDDVDNERLTWLRVYGVLLHVWNPEFFERLVITMGTYVSLDDRTINKLSLDVARILIRTKHLDLFHRVIPTKINGEVYAIKILEDWYGPTWWPVTTFKTSVGSEIEDEPCLGKKTLMWQLRRIMRTSHF